MDSNLEGKTALTTARLLAAAMALCTEVGVPRLPHHEQYRRALAAAQAGLDEVEFAAAWAAGQAMAPELRRAEVEAALTPMAAPRPAATPGATTSDAAGRSGLTPRELEVLRLVAAGRTDKEIGEALFISPRTAMGHVANILAKLGVPARAAAAHEAARRGLV